MQNFGYKGCPGGVAPCGLDKDPFQADGVPLNDANQWAPGDIMQVTQQSGVQRFTGSSTATWRPLSWMQNEGTIGIDLAAVNFFQLCRTTECPPQSSTAKQGRVTDNQGKNRNFSAKLASTSTWNPLNWMNVKTSLGADYTNLESDFANTNGTILPPGASTVASASTRNASNQQPNAVKTLGLYIQEQAGIHDRLFLTAAIRTDQNSAFGTNFQQVYYPKVSASWIASDESFFPRFSWLNQLRLRSAYGASGVQPGSTQGLIVFTPATVALTGRNGTTEVDQPGLTASQPGNSNLKPERSSELEAGFDAQLIDNKVHFEYTFWSKKTTDALVQISLAPSSTASQLTPLLNVGSTKGWGHEVQANAQLINLRNFGWDILVSGSHFSNKVLALGTVSGNCQTAPGVIVSCLRTASGSTSGEARQIPGHPINEQWYRPYTYADANGDGILQVSRGPRRFRLRELRVPDAARHLLRSERCRSVLAAPASPGDVRFQGRREHARRRQQLPVQHDAVRVSRHAGSDGAARPPGGGDRQDLRLHGRGHELQVVSRLLRQQPVLEVPRVLGRASAAAGRSRRACARQSGSSLVFGARNLKTWSSYTGIDPEANYGLSQSEAQNEFQTTGLPTYFTLRLNLKY